MENVQDIANLQASKSFLVLNAQFVVLKGTLIDRKIITEEEYAEEYEKFANTSNLNAILKSLDNLIDIVKGLDK